MKNDKIVSALRKHLNLPEIYATDDEILEATKGTLMRQSIELRLAMHDLKDVVLSEFKKILNIMSNWWRDGMLVVIGIIVYLLIAPFVLCALDTQDCQFYRWAKQDSTGIAASVILCCWPVMAVVIIYYRIKQKGG